QEGNLFTRPATATTRLFAGLLGIVFGGVFIYELKESSVIDCVKPLLAIALIAYSLGATNLLIKIQGGNIQPSSLPESPNFDSATESARRVLRLLLILIIGVAGIVAVFYGCLWVLGHPEAGTPIIILLTIAFAAFIPLRYLSFLMELYHAIKKRD